MANTFAPFGFQQRSGTGSSPTYEQIEGTGASTTAAIFFGDPLFRLSDGTLAGATTGPGPGTGVLAGIFIGCKYLSQSIGRTVWNRYWPGFDVAAGNLVSLYYVNDPNAQFLVSSDATGLTSAAVGLNVQFSYGTGTAANGLSGAFITGGSLATTATLPFRVVSLLTNPPGANGTLSGAFAQAVVAFNNVETKSLTAQN